MTKQNSKSERVVDPAQDAHGAAVDGAKPNTLYLHPGGEQTVFVIRQVECGMVQKSHYVRRVTQQIQPNELSRREAALFLGVSLRTLDRLREDGEIEGFGVRGCVRIPVDSIEAYKQRQREAARQQREQAGRPQVKDDFEIAVPLLAERRRRAA